MKNHRSFTIAAMAAIIGINAMTLVNPAYASEDYCKDITIIGARGTGEGQAHGEIAGFGDAVSKAVSVLKENVQAEASGVDFRTIDVQYPAASPSFDNGKAEYGEAAWDMDDYSGSVATGVWDAYNRADAAVAMCPKTTLIMMGYSQGAQVIHNAAQYLEQSTKDRLAYIWLISDPSVRHQSSPSPALAYSFNQNIQKYTANTVGAMHAYGIQAGYYGVQNTFFPSDLRGKVIEVCHDDDRICDIPYSEVDGYTGDGTFWGATSAAFASILDPESVHGTAYKTSGIHTLPSALATPRIVRMIDGARGNFQVSGTTFPMTISDCQAGITSMQLIQRQESSNNQSCLRSTGALRGGYGGLLEDANNCEASSFFREDTTGISWPSTGPANCDDVLRSWISHMKSGGYVIIDVPVFGAVQGTGGDTRYNIVSYRKFRVQGWKLDGTTYEPRNFRNTSLYTGTLACTGPCRGIIGNFLSP